MAATQLWYVGVFRVVCVVKRAMFFVIYSSRKLWVALLLWRVFVMLWEIGSANELSITVPWRSVLISKYDIPLTCWHIWSKFTFLLRVIVLIRDQNAGQNGNLKTCNKSFAVEQFKYLGATLTNQNSIREEIKSWLKSGNACCHSVQNLLSSSLLSKMKILRYTEL